MARARSWILILLLSGVTTPGLRAQAPDDPVSEAIRLRLEQLREQGEMALAGVALDARSGLAELYELRGFRPLWTSADRSEALRRFVHGVEADGLRPADYHAGVLDAAARIGGSLDAEDAAELDLLRTDAFIRVAHDLHGGRVDPSVLDPTWHVDRAGGALSPEALDSLASQPSVLRALDSLRPQHPIYRGMMQALERYRRLASDGGWPRLPDSLFLGPDSVGPEVEVLRRRLVVEGFLPPGSRGSQTYDARLEDAVKAFQHLRGLNEDGVVGPSTVSALNVPAAARVEALRVNLERARWVLRELEDTAVVVNIAGQKVYVLEGDSVALEMRAVVGKGYTRTPVFSAAMRYLVLNPTWTVPRSINGEILSHIRRDPGYLASQGFQILDAAGEEVDPDSVDFGRYSGASFPFVFRQRPGPTNALGRIKFMFPNTYNVYLHDTPERSLFQREERTFSHGCIRVQDPMALAAVLLGPESMARAREALAGRETLTLDLPVPRLVLVLYWTAAVDLDGDVHFYRDVYGRDGALLEALDAPEPQSSSTSGSTPASR